MSRLLRGHLGRPVPSLRDVMRLSLPPAVWMAAMQPTGGSSRSGASSLAGAETNVLALDFTDMSAVVRDTGTPANNFTGDPNSLLTYSSPSAKWIRLRSGLWASGSTMRTDYDASGNALGIPLEMARTSLAIRPRELGNATYWTATNITPSTVAGVDGVAGAASRITATAGNGTVLGSSNTSASAARRLAPFVRRVSGVGNLEWTLDGGSTWTAFSGITSSWQRIGVGATVTNPRVGFRIVDSGDAFDIDFANGETGAFDTSPMHVDGATGVITRAGDNITVTSADFPTSTSGTLYAVTRLFAVAAGTAHSVTMYLDGSNTVALLADNSVGLRGASIATAGVGQGFNDIGGSSSTVDTKQAFAFATNDTSHVINGGTPVTDATVTLPASLTTIRLGAVASGPFNMLNGHMSQFMFLPRRMSNAELQALTA
jgi:hypothetical protein